MDEGEDISSFSLADTFRTPHPSFDGTPYIASSIVCGDTLHHLIRRLRRHLPLKGKAREGDGKAGEDRKG